MLWNPSSDVGMVHCVLCRGVGKLPSKKIDTMLVHCYSVTPHTNFIPNLTMRHLCTHQTLAYMHIS